MVFASRAIGRFQLGSKVSLVPLHVVVLAPESNPYFPFDWFTKEDAAFLFDDSWSGDKSTVTKPAESPHDVVTSWSQKVDCISSWCQTWLANVIQPDRVFDQCDIQFRMVSFTQCVVRNDVFDSLDQKNPCNPDLQAARVNAALADCFELQELFKYGIPKVIFMGSLVRRDCALAPSDCRQQH
jgi:hypothetical protein